MKRILSHLSILLAVLSIGSAPTQEKKKICAALDVKIEDIVEVVPDESKTESK